MDDRPATDATASRPVAPRTTRSRAGLALFGAIFGFDGGDATGEVRADGGERD